MRESSPRVFLLVLELGLPEVLVGDGEGEGDGVGDEGQRVQLRRRIRICPDRGRVIR